jgi:peptide/nickel transport system permease protein
MTDGTPTTERSAGYARRIWRQYRRSGLALAGLILVALMFVAGFCAPLLANSSPIVCKYDGKWHAPGLIDFAHNIPFADRAIQKSPPFSWAGFDAKAEFQAERGDWALWTPIPFGPFEIAAKPLQPASRAHWLGTDEVGRDVLARMIYGAGVSMKVGFISMGIAVLIGMFFGATAGYWGGWTDIVISRFIEIVMCFPTFFLILGILAWFPPRIENVMIVIGLTGWTGIARYTRGEMLRLRSVDYTQAARALGAGHGRIVFRHLLPNSLAPVMVSVTFGIASAILVEAALSWLGFGVQQPQPSWGNMLRTGYDNLLTAPHLIPPPCIMIFLAVLAFNLVGDALRDVTDPRLSGSGKG